MRHTTHMLQKVIRISDWFQSFIPTILGYCFVWILLAKVPFSMELILTLLLFTISAIGFAMLGYLINDLFDIREDKIAGKQNLIGESPFWKKVSLLLVAIVLSFSPWLGLPFNNYILYLLIAQISLYILYNSPPIRLKKKPFISNIIDSMYAYLLPFVLSFLVLKIEQKELYTTLYWGSLVWFIVGLRNLLIHQMIDYEKDLRAGSKKSTVIFLGLKRSKQVLFSLLGIEIILFTGLIIIVSSFNYTLLLFLFILSLIVVNNLYAHYISKPSSLKSDLKLALFPNFIYQFHWPVFVLLILSFEYSFYWLIACILFITLLTPPHLIIACIKPSAFLYKIKALAITLWHSVIRVVLSAVLNYAIFFIFKLFGIDLKKENRSAISYIKSKFK